MTLLLAKHCTDGILIVSDGSRALVDGQHPDVIKYETGEKKILVGSRFGVDYIMALGGHAKMDGLKPVLSWMQAALAEPGPIADRVASGLNGALKDAQANGEWKDDAERIEWELGASSRSYVVAADSPNALWYIVEGIDGPNARDKVMPGHVVISQPGTGQSWEELRKRCIHSPMTLAQCVQHFDDLFEQAANTLPDGCKYPGHYGFIRSDGSMGYGGFCNAAELKAVVTSH